MKNKLIKLSIIVFILVFYSYGWSMEEYSLEESRVVRIIKYENFNREAVDFLDRCLERLLQLEDGKKLIFCLIDQIELTTKRISVKDSIIELPKFLYIKSSEKQSFKDVEKEKRFVIGLNFKELDKQNKLQTPCLGRLYNLDPEFIEIGSSSIPFYIVLGHELLHVQHYLTDPITYLKDSRDCSSQYWPIYYTFYKIEKLQDAPEIEKHIERIWKDAEEQKTVIGQSTSDFFPCELTLRMQDFISPRYAYQSAEDNFLEDSKIINVILSYHGIELKNVEIPKDFLFNEGKAKSSYLNSLKYKKRYPVLYNEELIQESKPELSEQQKKRLDFLKKKSEERNSKKIKEKSEVKEEKKK